MIWKFLFIIDIFSVIRAHTKKKKSFFQRALFPREGIPNNKTLTIIQE